MTTPPAAPAAPAAYASTYKALPSRPTVIRNATILTAAGPIIQNGALLLRDGKVSAVGTTVDAPADAQVIDASGKWVTPGIIDTHSHLGVYSAPGIESQQDGNELTDPVTSVSARVCAASLPGLGPRLGNGRQCQLTNQ